MNRHELIRRFIRPTWGDSELGSLSTEEITKWENELPARTGIGRRPARDARSLLGTILGDAAATKPPLIPYDPAIRPGNRGCRTGRRLARAPQRVWATPLQALLVAERAALLTGRDEDFTTASRSPTPGCAGARRSASTASTPIPKRSTPSGSFGSSGAHFTGSRRRTTRTTEGTNPDRAAQHGWSSSTPRSGPAR